MLGWRAAFWAVAVPCPPAVIGIGGGIPAGRGREGEAGGPALRPEIAQLKRPRLILVMSPGAPVNAATFGSFTFLAPLVTDGAGTTGQWVPVVPALLGAGSLAGVTLAGRPSDRRPGPVVGMGGPLLLLGWPTPAVPAEEPVALLALVSVQGAPSFAVGGTLITRVLHEAAGAPAMAGAYATAAPNAGAAVGPLVAAAGLGTAAGSRGPPWVSGLLVPVALLVAFPLREATAAARSREALR
ncbi:hypothetical protein SUDANB6_05442 [Streptomyces sp. enrichment culture]